MLTHTLSRLHVSQPSAVRGLIATPTAWWRDVARCFFVLFSLADFPLKDQIVPLTKNKDKIRWDVYGVRTAPRSGCFILKSRGADIRLWEKSRITTQRISTELQISRIILLVRSGYPPFREYVPERSGFFECATKRIYPLAGKVTDCYGADIRRYKCHGLLRSGYPSHPSHVFFRGAVYLTPSSKPHKTGAFPHGAP